MRLSKLIKGLKAKQILNFVDCNIYNLSMSSNSIDENGLFFAIKGNNVNGEDFVCDAIAKGCVAVVSANPLNVEIPQIIVEDVRIALSVICKNFYNKCDEKLKIISVVGTNGKTTTSTLIYNILRYSGKSVGLIGTNGVYINDLHLPNDMTTPDTIDLFYNLNQMVLFGVKYVVVEVSAHAIYYNKLYGIKCDIGVFTNISNEHLDFFGDMENYAKTKCGYFSKTNMKECVVNVDDEYGKKIAYDSGVPCLSYGLAYPSNAFAINIAMTMKGSSFVVNVENDVFKVKTNFVGEYNVYNVLASICVAKLLKISTRNIVNALAKTDGVDGRWQVFDFSNDRKVIIDYAHTPDGFEKVLSITKSLRPNGKLYTLFGCVGYSDKEKRAEMGRVASKYSDYVVLSTDNLCGRDFDEVCDDIVLTVPNTRINDRETAVNFAFQKLNVGDTLILLGKGNETKQKDNEISDYNEIEVVKKLKEKDDDK